MQFGESEYPVYRRVLHGPTRELLETPRSSSFRTGNQSVARYVSMQDMQAGQVPASAPPAEPQPAQFSGAAIRQAETHLPIASALLKHAEIVRRAYTGGFAQQDDAPWEYDMGNSRRDPYDAYTAGDLRGPEPPLSSGAQIQSYNDHYTQIGDILQELTRYQSLKHKRATTSTSGLMHALVATTQAGNKTSSINDFHSMCDDVMNVHTAFSVANLHRLYAHLSPPTVFSSASPSQVNAHGGPHDSTDVHAELIKLERVHANIQRKSTEKQLKQLTEFLEEYEVDTQKLKDQSSIFTSDDSCAAR